MNPKEIDPILEELPQQCPKCGDQKSGFVSYFSSNWHGPTYRRGPDGEWLEYFCWACSYRVRVMTLNNLKIERESE
jgi:hypothetical protein